MYFKERDVDQRFYNNNRVSNAISEEIPSYSYTGASYSPPVKVYGNRKGKWTTEEENYTNKVIWCFNAGTLPIAPDEVHVTLRSYLAEKLDCDPMRITKKYTGASCLGKKVYRIARCDDVPPEQLIQDQLELQMLEKAFLTKLDQIRSKKMLQGMSSEARHRSQTKDSSSSSSPPYSPNNMEHIIRQSMLDSYSTSSGYGTNRPLGPKSLPSPTNYHYSLPPSLLQVTNDHYLEQLKNDAAAAASATSLNNNEELARIPSLNSDLLFDTFGGPGSAFSSMGNLSGFGSFMVPTTPQESAVSAHVQQQVQAQQQSQSQSASNPTPYKHKQGWIQRSASMSNGGSPEVSTPPATTASLFAPSAPPSAAAAPVYPSSGENVSGVESDHAESPSPSRANQSLSPGDVIDDEGHLPPALLDHKQQQQQHVGLPDVYRTTLGMALGSPATSYDDNTVSSTGSKRKAGGLASNCSSASSSDSTLGGQEFKTFDNVMTSAAAVSTTGTEDSQTSSQDGNGSSSNNNGGVGFKKRKMSEDMTAAASSLLGFFSQFQNGVRDTSNVPDSVGVNK